MASARAAPNPAAAPMASPRARLRRITRSAIGPIGMAIASPIAIPFKARSSMVMTIAPRKDRSTANVRRLLHRPLRRRLWAAPLPMDEPEIAPIDQEPARLPDDEDRVETVDGIGEED